MKPSRATKDQLLRIHSVYIEVLAKQKDLTLKQMKNTIYHTIRRQDGLSVRNTIIKRHHILFVIRHKTW